MAYLSDDYNENTSIGNKKWKLLKHFAMKDDYMQQGFYQVLSDEDK